ncbi:hypothetical protein [Gilliamella apicola]|uniref:hypothetical protein n=1 Tax=Gilliamella apicola TaxID=1196095 RepID=UPI002FEE1993
MKECIEKKYGKNSMYYLSIDENIDVNYNDILNSWKTIHFKYIEEKGEQSGLKNRRLVEFIRY